MSEPRYLASTAALREMLESPTIGEDRKTVIRQELEARTSTVTHEAVRAGEGVTRCCGRTPFELPARDRFTITGGVDCPGRSRVEPRYVATFDSLHPLRGIVVDEHADRYCTFATLERAQRAADSWNQPPLIEFDPPMIWRSVIDGKRLDGVVRCDYCGDELPGVEHRSHVPTTPDLQRLGFSADKVVCPECVDRANRGRES